MVARVTVGVVPALPGNDGRQMRRALGRHAPLVPGIIGDAEHPDLTAAPGLGARPLDALVEVVDLPRAVHVQEGLRPARAPRVHSHAGVAVRDPALGVGHLPVLVLVGRHLENFGIVLDHLVPLMRIAILIGHALRVDSVGQDRRVVAFLDGPVDVRAQDGAVVHLDGHVPFDPHSVSIFDFMILVHDFPHLSFCIMKLGFRNRIPRAGELPAKNTDSALPKNYTVSRGRMARTSSTPSICRTASINSLAFDAPRTGSSRLSAFFSTSSRSIGLPGVPRTAGVACRSESPPAKIYFAFRFFVIFVFSEIFFFFPESD